MTDASQQPPAPPPGYYPRAQKTNVLAVISALCGLLWVFWLGSFAAVVMGHIARKQIREAGGAETGDSFGVVRLVLGWLGLGFLFSLFVVAVVCSMD